jgi:hypothetical protein
MKPVHIIIVLTIILLGIAVYLKKENFTLDNDFDSNMSEIEKKIKLLEFTMSSMKDNNLNTTIINEKKPYKSVNNYY